MTNPVVPAASRALRTGRHPLIRLLRSPIGLAGAVWLTAITVASMTAPLWLPYPTDQQALDATKQLPSAAHLLGTDELGRDLLSRIFAAGAPSLFTSAIAAIVAVGVALPAALGVAAAGPRVAKTVNNIADILLSVPSIVVILAVIAAVGSNLPLVMAILGLLISAGIYRVFVGQASSLRSQLYVDAAQVDGMRSTAISFRHVLPNMATTVLVQFVLVFAIGLMIQAGLAFIGFGPKPPEPSWGGLIQAASQHVYDAPWLMVPTGLVLALTVLSANAVADTLAAGGGLPASQIPLTSSPRRKTAPAAATGTESADDLVVDGLRIGVEADGTTLVDGVSLTVEPGTVLGIVGESGCGKSMTALSLLGLLPAGVAVTAGSIRWRGRDLAKLSEKDFAQVRGREIALVSQEPMRALDPMFTVGYQLGWAVRRLRSMPRREARVEAESLLSQVGIADATRVLRLYPHQVSGGMAQRIAIALALAGRPRVLVADEPTTALDVTVQSEILSLLRDLVRTTGMSLVVVTHDLGVVADICDRVAVMYAGQVVESGGVDEVLSDAEHPYTMGLLAADPHAQTGGPRERLVSIPGQVPAPADWPPGCRFSERCRFALSECSAPVRLAPRTVGSGDVRCVRAPELRRAPGHRTGERGLSHSSTLKRETR